MQSQKKDVQLLTNVWHEEIDWNGLIFPAVLDDLKGDEEQSTDPCILPREYYFDLLLRHEYGLKTEKRIESTQLDETNRRVKQLELVNKRKKALQRQGAQDLDFDSIQPTLDETDDDKPQPFLLGDISFDIDLTVERSKQKQAATIEEIDRIRQIDLPWKMYVAIYAGVLIFLALLSGVAIYNMILPMGQLAMIVVVFFIMATFVTIMIMFFGFQEEEIRDAIQLAQLHNEVKKERKVQQNQERMGLKMKKLNLAREQIDLDRQFVRNLNMLRMQSLSFFEITKQVQQISEMKSYVDEIMIRLREVVFANALFLKRLYLQTNDILDVDQLVKSKEGALVVVRELFSYHLLMSIFGEMIFNQQKRTPDSSPSKLPKICRDNLEILVKRSKIVIQAESLRKILSTLTGLRIEKIDEALSTEPVLNFKNLEDKIKRLIRLYSLTLEALPKRQYIQADDEDDIENSSFSEGSLNLEDMPTLGTSMP